MTFDISATVRPGDGLPGATASKNAAPETILDRLRDRHLQLAASVSEQRQILESSRRYLQS